MKTFADIVGSIFAIVALALGFVFLIFVFASFGALLTMVFVNYLFTPTLLVLIFGVAKLTFFKAFALNVLMGVLLSSTHVKK